MACVRDQRRWNVLWWLSYLLLLPIGPGLRAVWEWRGYRMTLLAEMERRGAISGYTQQNVVDWLCGPLYLWCCPRSVAEWLVRREVARIGAAAARDTKGP